MDVKLLHKRKFIAFFIYDLRRKINATKLDNRVYM
jgi:hypothetical protein